MTYEVMTNIFLKGTQNEILYHKATCLNLNIISIYIFKFMIIFWPMKIFLNYLDAPSVL